MLVDEGIQGFGMNRLAQSCGISVATLYIYYKDKDDLIKKIGAEIGELFMLNTLKGFSANMHFAAGLKIQWKNRAAFAIKFPREVACYEILRNTQYGDYIMQESLKEFKTAMVGFCQNAIDNKELIALPVEVFWSVAYGPLYMLLRFHNEGKSIGGKAFKLSPKKMDEALNLVLKALTPSAMFR